MSSDVLFTPMADTTDCRINGERLWNSLMTLAEIGATPKGGCCRQSPFYVLPDYYIVG